MENKKHDCIEKTERDYLKKYFGYAKVRLHGHFDNKTYTEITAWLNHRKRDGSFILKSERQQIDHNYCPFCGIKY